MACCGQKRNRQKLEQNPNRENNSQAAHWNITPEVKKGILFRYTGNAPIQVIGAITFRKYSFRHKSETLEVDFRDVNAMLAVPYLERIHRMDND